MFIGSMEVTILAYSVMPVKQLWLQIVYVQIGYEELNEYNNKN